MMKLAAYLALSALPVFGQYSARRDGDVVRLEDGRTQTVVSVMPGHGNSAFEMKVKGKNVLRFPYASVDEYRKGRELSGIPFLAPWANRLDDAAFFANGKKYPFNLELGNVRPGPTRHPIHGFLTNATQWEVVEAKADRNAAWVTSRLEFYRQPDWMAQFPFAHTIEMTYRLAEGALEVITKLHNLSAEPMPVAIGFHPYFQVNDAPRDDWTFGIAARIEWILNADKIPTGETRPIEQFLPKPQGGTLRGLNLDHVFGDLVRDASGKATMWVQGKAERVEVAFGPNYRAVVVYSPGGPNRDFICFEPMTGITDALNLAQRGMYKELQSIPSGQTWQESFWVTPRGF
ncbi:MAG TPA: aldose 1-epimerase [Bryobacteraceae bacterium]|nr:aldose 1-epimerase [Bryobacteraceae bacterium]